MRHYSVSFVAALARVFWRAHADTKDLHRRQRRFGGGSWLGGCRARGGGGPALISTWEFGRAANTEAWKTLASGGNALDAVERGVNLVELDPNNLSVGFGFAECDRLGLPQGRNQSVFQKKAGSIGQI